MKIGLISDTHIPSMGKEPPPEVVRAFEGVDLIFHAGDIYIQSCIEWLEQIAPVHATTSFFAGVGEGVPRASTPIVVEIEGHSIGIVHKLEMTPLGDEVFPGTLAHYPAGKSIPVELEDIFGKPVDIVVFGYTHEAMVETHQGVLFVNPGSPTMVKQSMTLGHVAMLELTSTSATAEIIDLTTLRG
ncbi:MAG: metallophosphoesterase [Chloroflexi bacterium]|nr:MAG: metallophosphoesterase [Chloroflexota bacterium]